MMIGYIWETSTVSGGQTTAQPVGVVNKGESFHLWQLLCILLCACYMCQHSPDIWLFVWPFLKHTCFKSITVYIYTHLWYSHCSKQFIIWTHNCIFFKTFCNFFPFFSHLLTWNDTDSQSLALLALFYQYKNYNLIWPLLCESVCVIIHSHLYNPTCIILPV